VPSGTQRPAALPAARMGGPRRETIRELFPKEESCRALLERSLVRAHIDVCHLARLPGWVMKRRPPPVRRPPRTSAQSARPHLRCTNLRDLNARSNPALSRPPLMLRGVSRSSRHRTRNARIRGRRWFTSPQVRHWPNCDTDAAAAPVRAWSRATGREIVERRGEGVEPSQRGAASL
jgi:hypothetical protein